MSLVAAAELLLAEARRAEGPGVAKAGEHPEVLRWRGQAHTKQLHKVSQLKRLGFTQADIARRMHISEPHLSKLISDGFSKGNRFGTDHSEALDEILLQAMVEAVNCG